MATLLLIVVYILFIALGIPDSLFGTAWPAIYPDLSLPVSSASVVTICTVGCTILSSLFAEKVIRRFGTAWTAAVSTGMTALGLIVLSYSQNLWWFCLCAIPLGLGAGAIDTAMNNYVALHYGAMQMSFLHCFYGVGVSVSPYLMSLMLEGSGGWRGGYRLAFLVQGTITLIAFLSIPLWTRRRVSGSAAESEAENKALRALSTKDVAKDPAVRTAWLVFIASCGLEYICGSWGATFLVNAKGLTVDAAAACITFYYIGMTLGRFLSGLLTVRWTPWRVIGIGQIAVAAAVILLLLPLPGIVATVALFLIGLGNGPLYPNMMYLTPKNFGVAASQAVVGTQVSAAYVGILILPAGFSLLVQWVGVETMPFVLALLFAALIGAILLLRRYLKARGRA